MLHIQKWQPNPRMCRMLKGRLVRRPLPDHRLKPIQKVLLSQRKRLLQKNGDNSSKPDGFYEAACSTMLRAALFASWR
jgi:hypothetical protein